MLLLVLQHSGPEVKWVDGGKPLFKVSTHLVSTVYTQVSFTFEQTVRVVTLLLFLFFVCVSHLKLGCDFIATRLHGINFCVLDFFVSLIGSTFAQFLSSLSEHCICTPGVRRRAGQIPEGKKLWI